MSKPAMYTEDEIRHALKDRQGGFSLQQYAIEIGISAPFLSQILSGSRSVSNEKVLQFLAPPGLEYVKREVYYLMPK